MIQKQVNKIHYEFSRYMSKERWNSVWHQLDEVLQFNPTTVLEVGPGPGLFKHVASLFGLNAETLDIDPDLGPDHVGSATELPFEDNSYDVVCAFQMLEHLPYETSLLAFREMARVSRRYVIISLPDARVVWPCRIHLPKLGSWCFLIPRPIIKRRNHVFDGEHYWEIDKVGYDFERVSADLNRFCKLIKTYRVFENPYHRFFVFENW